MKRVTRGGERRKPGPELKDPVSKQPHFKFAAVQVRKAGTASLGARVADAAAKAVDRVKELAGISADLLAVAAAIAAARPEHLAAPLESLKKQLAARHARESA